MSILNARFYSFLCSYVFNREYLLIHHLRVGLVADFMDMNVNVIQRKTLDTSKFLSGKYLYSHNNV